MYVSAKIAAEYYNVSESTLRNWANDSIIEYITTEGGHRRYQIPDKAKTGEKETCVYARVSSRKQEADLNRQIVKLFKFRPKVRLYQDIGSALNFQRPGFKTLVERVIRGEIKEIVVTERDRFTRCGFEFFEWLFSIYGTQITIISDSNIGSGKNPEKEFTDNLMSIITTFTARYYGKRHGVKYHENVEDKDISDDESKTDIQ